MNFILETDFLDKYTNNQPFFCSDVHVKQRRHFIFTTDRQLDIPRKAKTWYIDGTFKVVKNPFYQLLSVHAFVRAGDYLKQLLLVYCVMSGKSKKDYKKVFQAILDLLPLDPEVQSFVVDFESGLWRALRSLFNNPDIRGCAFHWGQAVWRKVQEKGLQTAYTQRDDVYKFLRKVFALPFLPADHILDTFTLLQQKAVGEQLQSVMQYVNDTWMQSTIWLISSCSVFCRSVRTNNDTEGWHHHLNREAKKGNLPFYVLLKLLTRQALAVPLQVKLLSEGSTVPSVRRPGKPRGSCSPCGSSTPTTTSALAVF